jgi:putative FmdB family regulatory protein
MPLYAYRCKSCDHEFERHQRMSDKPLQECPVCAGEVRRLISNVGVVFKGSGFYITDNRNGANGSKKGETAKSAEKSEKKPDSETTKSDKSSTSESAGTSTKSTGSATTNTAAAD